jgi:hypothetical protein
VTFYSNLNSFFLKDEIVISIIAFYNYLFNSLCVKKILIVILFYIDTYYTDFEIYRDFLRNFIIVINKKITIKLNIINKPFIIRIYNFLGFYFIKYYKSKSRHTSINNKTPEKDIKSIDPNTKNKPIFELPLS